MAWTLYQVVLHVLAVIGLLCVACAGVLMLLAWGYARMARADFLLNARESSRTAHPSRL